MKYPAPVAFAFALSLLFFVAGLLALGFPPEHRLVPFLIVIPGCAISLLVLVTEIGVIRRGVDAPEMPTGSGWRSDAGRLAWVGVYMGAVTVLGFPIGLPIAVLAYAARAGERLVTSIVLAGAAILIVIVFESQFQLRFPAGLLFGLF